MTVAIEVRFLILVLISAAFAAGSGRAEPPLISWADLRDVSDPVCEEWYEFSRSVAFCDGAPMETAYHACAARTVTLGKPVRIAGYAHPTDMKFDGVTEFMLSPSFLPCTHTPPPMGNQLILVEYPEGAKISFDPVFVTGTIEPELALIEMMQIRYRMTATRVEPATLPDVLER